MALTGRQMLKNASTRMAGKKKKASKSSAFQDLSDLMTQVPRAAAFDGMRKRVIQGRQMGQKAKLNPAGNLDFSPRGKPALASAQRFAKKGKIKKRVKQAKKRAAKQTPEMSSILKKGPQPVKNGYDYAGRGNSLQSGYSQEAGNGRGDSNFPIKFDKFKMKNAKKKNKKSSHKGHAHKSKKAMKEC